MQHIVVRIDCDLNHEEKTKRKKEAAPDVPGKSPSPVLMWPTTA